MQGSRNLLEYKAPSIAGELKESRERGTAGQLKGELSATFLGQGGEMPGLLTAQVWTSALETCWGCVWDNEEAQLDLCLLSNTKCVIVLPWCLHGLLITMAQQHYLILVKKMLLHHSSLEGSLCSVPIFLQDKVHASVLSLPGGILYFTLVVLLCNRVTKHDCYKPTLGGPLQSSSNLPDPHWLL